MRIYIVRHGDPDYANDTLTKNGELEAQALARRLAGYNLDELYSSPLGRAQKTASYTQHLTNREVITLPWATEWSFLGHVDTPLGDVARWDIPGEIYRPLEEGSYDVSEYNNYVPDEAVVKEQFEKLALSSDAFLKEYGYVKEGCRYRITESSDKQIALFCHNGFGLAWIAYLLNISYRVVWSSFWLAPTSVTTILFEERSQNFAVPRALSVGDTSHLYEERLPVNPRGIHGRSFF